MPITQILLTANSGGGGGANINFYGWVSSMNEGSTNTVTVDYENYPLTTIYWQIVDDGTSNDDFIAGEPGGAQLGNFQISGTGSTNFSWTTTEDLTTEGNENYLLQVGTFLGGANLLNETLTITDTSITPPVAPFSLNFPAGNPYLLVSNTQSDWNLGTTYTIEFWSKQTTSSDGGVRTVMSQGPSSGNIDLGFMFTNTLFRDVQQSGIPEPTPAVWSHVAYVADGGGDTKVYYNGVLRGTMVNPGALSNGSSDLNIGRRAGVNGQGYLGKLAMIRISTTAKYVANFSPSLSYGAGADTRLMLGSDTPLTDSVGTHPISVQGAVTVSDDFPSFRSLEFVENQGDYLDVAGSSDWNLGTTWTIEFWLKANAASATAGGGIWGLLNQVGWSTTNAIVVALSDNKLVFLSGSNANEDVRYTEPTPGVWTHVAIVNNAGTQTVWYNGVEQTKVSGTFGTASYTNSTDPLRIGRLGPANGGTLNGKMAMVRISNSAKYSAAFTATTTYNFETGTKLFLSKFTPTIDTVQHTITNNGVATSTDLPQTFIDHPHPNTGGTLVATFCLFGDPNITAFAAIPVGARITSNIPGFGIRLVTASAPHVTGRIITYDGTGLSGTSSTSDRYNFYW